MQLGERKPGVRGPFASAAVGSPARWLPSQISIHAPCRGTQVTPGPARRGLSGPWKGALLLLGPQKQELKIGPVSKGLPLHLGVAWCMLS